MDLGSGAVTICGTSEEWCPERGTPVPSKEMGE